MRCCWSINKPQVSTFTSMWLLCCLATYARTASASFSQPHFNAASLWCDIFLSNIKESKLWGLVSFASISFLVRTSTSYAREAEIRPFLARYHSWLSGLLCNLFQFQHAVLQHDKHVGRDKLFPISSVSVQTLVCDKIFKNHFFT